MSAVIRSRLTSQPALHEPAADCAFCPRLSALRASAASPAAGRPVTAVGSRKASLLIVAPAPSHHEDTGILHPFADRQSASLVFSALHASGFAEAAHDPFGTGADGEPAHYRIICATRCHAPESMPQPSEIESCNQFLKAEVQTMPALRVVLTLGVLAHNTTLAACGVPFSRNAFLPGEVTTMPDGLLIADSHHISRENIANGHVSEAGLLSLLKRIRTELTH